MHTHLAGTASPETPQVFPWTFHPRIGHHRYFLLFSGWEGDERPGLECVVHEMPRRASGRRSDQRSGRAWGGDCGGYAAAADQRPLGERAVYAPEHAPSARVAVGD